MSRHRQPHCSETVRGAAKRRAGGQCRAVIRLKTWKEIALQHLNNHKFAQILARVQESDSREAWDAFFAAYRRKICSKVAFFCKQLLDGHSDLQLQLSQQDLVQDICLKLCAKKRKALLAFKGDSEAAFLKYLSVIAHNLVVDQFNLLRARKRYAPTVSLDERCVRVDACDEIPLSETIRSLCFDVELTMRADELHEIVNELLVEATQSRREPERDQLIFRLAVFDELTPRQIADQLPYSVEEKTIKNILSSLKAYLRAELLKRWGMSP